MIRSLPARFCNLARSELIGSSDTICPMQTATPLYTEEHIVAYPVEYIAGIDLYNAGEVPAAHDAWEERWMGPVAADEQLSRQPVNQSAVPCHHSPIGRPGPAPLLYPSGNAPV